MECKFRILFIFCFASACYLIQSRNRIFTLSIAAHFEILLKHFHIHHGFIQHIFVKLLHTSISSFPQTLDCLLLLCLMHCLILKTKLSALPSFFHICILSFCWQFMLIFTLGGIVSLLVLILILVHLIIAFIHSLAKSTSRTFIPSFTCLHRNRFLPFMWAIFFILFTGSLWSCYS